MTDRVPLTDQHDNQLVTVAGVTALVTRPATPGVLHIDQTIDLPRWCGSCFRRDPKTTAVKTARLLVRTATGAVICPHCDPPPSERP